MKIYYTGAKTYLGIQKDPSISLGGLISSTEIPNGLLSNLFGTLSRYTIQQGKPEMRVVVVKNDEASLLAGLKAYFTYPNDDQSPSTDTNECTFLIGYGAVSSNDCGDLSVESLSSIYSLPYTVTLQSAVGVGEAIDLPNLDVDSYLGIFIKRVVKSSTQAVRSDTDLAAILAGTLVLETQEDISLTFAWD